MKPAIAPIGLDYLADAVISAGHDARLLDLCFSTDITSDIETAARDFNPDVIGLSVRNTDDCYFSGGSFFLPEIKGMIEDFRRCSDAPVVLGGVGFSVMPEAAMKFCGADYGIAGEGEEPFVRLLDALKNRSDLTAVPGLIYWENCILRSNSRSACNLDNLSRTRSFTDNALYFREGGQAGIETKRGCNMDCIFCADPVSKGRHIRLRSPELIVEELKSLLAQGIDHFHTCDCEFNIPGDHAKDICRAIIDSGISDRIHWYAYCSILPFDAEMADLFKRAGCAGVDFGADSGCDEMLHRLGRHFTSSDLAHTADLCHRYAIPFMYDLLIGGPGETRETVRQTIELMREIDADCVGLSMGVRIYEGTKMAQWVLAQGNIEANPNIYGAKTDNPNFLRPVFYISPDLGLEMVDTVCELVAGDTRFFLPLKEEVDSNYNYNDNTVLVRAIKAGARGAYWNILREGKRAK